MKLLFIKIYIGFFLNMGFKGFKGYLRIKKIMYNGFIEWKFDDK